jgi:hypothetical protein
LQGLQRLEQQVTQLCILGYISGVSLSLFPFLAHPDACRFGKVDGNKHPDYTNDPISQHQYSVFLPVSLKIEPAPSWAFINDGKTPQTDSSSCSRVNTTQICIVQSPSMYIIPLSFDTLLYMQDRAFSFVCFSVSFWKDFPFLLPLSRKTRQQTPTP